MRKQGTGGNLLLFAAGCKRIKALELTFLVAGLDEIKQWVMSLGPEAYVEEPKNLRDKFKADMKKALFQYEGIKSARQEPVLESRVDYV